MAIGKDNSVHFAWGSNNEAKYRSLVKGKLSLVETVAAIDRLFIAVLATRDEKIILVTDKPLQADGQPSEIAGPLVMHTRTGNSINWSSQIIPPTEGTHTYSMPSIIELENGDIIIAARSKNLHTTGILRHPYIQWRYSNDKWSLPMVIRGHYYEPNLYPDGDRFFNATWTNTFQTVVFNDYGICLASPFDTVASGYLRGQKCGFTITSDGNYYASASNQWELNRLNGRNNRRQILLHHRFYYSISSDQGKTWKIHKSTEDTSGQGFGDIASNHEWVMMVWPDMREGIHLRYSLIKDNP